MANLIPAAPADVELQISTAIAVGATSFTLNSAHDDDGNPLPAGKYCFTIDSGTSNKEYLMGQLNGTDVTDVVSVSRQGAETVGAVRTHRVGAPAIITNFATLQRVADILRGILTLDGASPVGYDLEPTLADRKDLATVGYVLDVVSGGTVVMNAQVLAATAGETFTAGSLVYFNTADQEWYRTDADTLSTVQNTQIGIALGAGANGVAIPNGVQISGSWTTTGLTAGSTYYVSNTTGGISTTAGTNSRVVGFALSTTRLLLLNHPTRGAFTADTAFGVPSDSNRYLTQTYAAQATRTTYTSAGSPHTWTKKSGLRMVRVQLWGAGGSGGIGTGGACGGSGGGYAEQWYNAADLGATETITVGAGGASVSLAGGGSVNGNSGSNTTFGSLLTAYAGGGGSGTTSTVGGTGGGSSFAAAAGTVDAGAGGTSGGGAGGNGTTGGAGSAGAAGATVGAAGLSIYGGGAGGSVSTTVLANAGGVSKYGGAGGAGVGSSTNATVVGVAGATPAGGGGGAASGTGSRTSGAGGSGQAIITEFYA